MLRKKPKERIEDVSTPVDRKDVLGLVGVYVDDTLVTGPKTMREGVAKALQKLWKTGEPEFLTPRNSFRLLGMKVVMTKLGLCLRQHFYADEFLLTLFTQNLKISLLTSSTHSIFYSSAILR